MIKKNVLGVVALILLSLFILGALYAPFLASSKPLFVVYEGTPYFPLFRYLLYPGFFTKRLDLFFNLFSLLFPFCLAAFLLFKNRRKLVIVFSLFLQVSLYLLLTLFPLKNPATSSIKETESFQNFDWNKQLASMSDYQRLNLALSSTVDLRFQKRMEIYTKPYAEILSRRLQKPIVPDPSILPTLWNQTQNRINDQIKELQERENPSPLVKTKLSFLEERRTWLLAQPQEISFLIMPLLRPFHWEEDAGGNQLFNEIVPWWDLTRVNRKDLTSAIIFGTRISLVVGLGSVAIAFLIGVPLGAMAGYFGGAFDLALSRILEVWEGMPTFFMLLMIVAITESKSVGWVILIIGLFGWTSFARYVRGESYRLKPLGYIEAGRILGYSTPRILFGHLIPNAVSPVLTLLPFAIMAAIISESGLSFLGLGEEGSCSWGVLMDEGRGRFPAESYLLFPPAITLSLLLITMALLGDLLRDHLDPKLKS